MNFGADTTSGRSDGFYITAWGNIGPSDYYPNASSHKYRIDGTRTYYTVTRAEYANQLRWNSQIPSFRLPVNRMMNHWITATISAA